jgi:hypothetical protein
VDDREEDVDIPAVCDPVGCKQRDDMGFDVELIEEQVGRINLERRLVWVADQRTTIVVFQAPEGEPVQIVAVQLLEVDI